MQCRVDGLAIGGELLQLLLGQGQYLAAIHASQCTCSVMEAHGLQPLLHLCRC